MHRRYLLVTVVSACVSLMLLAPRAVWADAQVHEWLGEYTMNHDGFVGTLYILDTKQDCASPAWCRLSLSYVNAEGVRARARVETMDQRFQHMVFVVEFPGNRQRFDAYIMSWDKTTIAGTTDWGGRRFGFYAIRKPAPAVADDRGRLAERLRERRAGALSQAAGATLQPATPAGNPAATLLPDGRVETTLPDGSKRIQRPGDCGYTIIRPDGQTSQVMCSTQVQYGNPPGVPDGVTGKWLGAHNDSLLNIIRGLVGSEASVNNYLSNVENENPTVYDRIRLRTELIRLLSSP